MVKKIIVPSLLALFVGGFLGAFLLKQYEKEELETVGNVGEAKEVYFLQVGVYSTLENMKASISKIPYYIYQIEDEKYYVYVAMSLNEENANKLKDFFISTGYNIYVKKFKVANSAFLTVLEQYDIMLKQAETSSYSAICGQILSKYEELVNSEREDQGTA